MGRLNSYKTRLLPNVKLESYPKKTLIELLKVYGKLYQTIDGFWFLSVKEKLNNDEAIKCDLWVWEKQLKGELKRIGKALDIKDNNVEAFFKIFQMSPWTWTTEYELEIVNPNHGKMTVLKCPTLEALEKEGQGRDGIHCKAVEIPLMDLYAKTFNPKMSGRFLKIPPRPTKNESCCVWEFKVDENK